MSAPAKTLSPSELAKLEHAFATDPTSEAYRPLAEAYLAMGRFMEAMVVCKKGVKAHPTKPDPRMLLARVYSDQGKDKKALEELLGALTVSPSHRPLLRTIAALQSKNGEMDAARTTLLKAYELDPADAETRAAMLALKVEPPQGAVPPSAVASVGTPSPSSPPPVLVPGVGPLPTPSPLPGSNVHIRGPAQAPAATARPTGQRRAVQNAASGARATGTRPAFRPSEDDHEDSMPPRLSRKQEARAKAFAVFTGAMAVFLLGYFIWGQWHGKNVKEFTRAEQEAVRALQDDTYESYKRACTAAETALERNSSSASAHGVLAYAEAVRWAEHGGGDDARKRAEEQVAAGKALGEDDPRLFAAEALLQANSGKGASAIEALRARIKQYDSQGKVSALLYATLGVLEMNAGDYEHSLDDLSFAQRNFSTDARIYAELGTLYRRRGEDRQAWNKFDTALKYKPNHPDAMLGESLIMLDSDRHGFYPKAAAILKKLLDVQPPPSPRQLAQANMARAILIARVQNILGTLKPEERNALLQSTGVPADARQAHEEIKHNEDLAMQTLDPGNPDLHLMKAHRLVAEGNFDAAVDEVKQAVHLDGTRPQFYVELARLLLKSPQKAKEAAAALASAIARVGPSPKLVFLLGQAYRLDNRPEDAIRQFQKAVENPKDKNPEARVALANIYFERKDFARAEEQLTLAAAEMLGQSAKIAEVNTLLGRIHESKNDRLKAEAFYKKAIASDGDFADAYYFLAHLFSGSDATRAQASISAHEYLNHEPNGTYAAEARHWAM